MTKRELRTYRKVGERGIVYPVDSDFAAVPKRAAIERDAQPSVEVIGDTGTNTSGIRFQPAAYRQQPQRKHAVHISAGMKEGNIRQTTPIWVQVALE